MMVDGPHSMLQVGVTSLALAFRINILFSVSAGQEEVVQELVGAGADVNRKNDKGITPLFVFRFLCLSTLCVARHFRHYAASKSRIEVRVL